MRGLLKAQLNFNATAMLPERWHQRFHHQRVRHQIQMLASPSVNRAQCLAVTPSFAAVRGELPDVHIAGVDLH